MVIVPERICEVCGEFLPHACAPVILRKREPFTGKRIIKIIDRENHERVDTASRDNGNAPSRSRPAARTGMAS